MPLFSVTVTGMLGLTFAVFAGDAKTGFTQIDSVDVMDSAQKNF